MADNLTLYESLRAVPDEAKKAIAGGRLRGKTDINPMWRLKMLTQAFGPCGVGWVAPIVRSWIEEGAGGERTANVEIALRYRVGEVWSEPIAGVGGSMLVSREKGDLYTDDDAYKKAYTDAISVACKALGMAADVYFERDVGYGTKYDGTPPADGPPPAEALLCTDCGREIADGSRRSGETWPAADVAGYTARKFGRCLCISCGEEAGKCG